MSNLLLILIFVVFIIAVIMIVLYFVTLIGYDNVIHFKWEFSKESTDWGYFGSYFASITGLLAFAGVLYTIKISNENNRASEERGTFFKMLELYQKQFDAVTCNGKKSIEAFELYGKKANDDLILYVTLNRLKKIENNEFQVETNESEAINGFKNTLINSNVDISVRKLEQDINGGTFDEYMGCLNDAKEYFDSLTGNMKDEERSQAMGYVGNLIHKENGHFLGQYCRTINNLLQLISNFKESKTYYEIFKDQLSRYELLILLYSALSKQSKLTDVILLKNNYIFENLPIEDIIFIYPKVKDKWDIIHKMTINGILKSKIKYLTNEENIKSKANSYIDEVWAAIK